MAVGKVEERFPIARGNRVSAGMIEETEVARAGRSTLRFTAGPSG
jgi:hypothetical protein